MPRTTYKQIFYKLQLGLQNILWLIKRETRRQDNAMIRHVLAEKRSYLANNLQWPFFGAGGKTLVDGVESGKRGQERQESGKRGRARRPVV